MKAPLITNWLNSLAADEQGDNGFVMLLSDLLPNNTVSLNLSADLGIENEPEEAMESSYLETMPQADYARIGSMINGGFKVFECIIPTEDDTLAIYLFGMDEQSVLDDLKARYEELGRGDI